MRIHFRKEKGIEPPPKVRKPKGTKAQYPLAADDLKKIRRLIARLRKKLEPLRKDPEISAILNQITELLPGEDGI